MRTIEHVAEYHIYRGTRIDIVSRNLDGFTPPIKHARWLAANYMADNPECQKIKWTVKQVVTETTITDIETTEIVRQGND